MMTRTLLSIASVLLLLMLCVAVTSTARAESKETDALTLGWMTENADLVAVLDPVVGSRPLQHRVTQPIRGVDAPETLHITLPRGRGVPRGRVLAFLKRSGETWVPITLGHAVKSLASEAPGSRGAGNPPSPAPERSYVEPYALALAADGSVSDPAALASLIPKFLSGDEGTLPFSAGRDLVRHASVLKALTAESRALVTAALLRDRKPDQDLASIIVASGFAGDAGTDARLIQLLRDGKVRNVRRHLVQALSRRASEEQVKRLTTALKDATPKQQTDLAVALGGQARPSAEAPLVGLLASKDSRVQSNAAHGLGTLARALRKQDRTTAVAVRRKLSSSRVPLRRLVSEAKTRDPQRAAVWALAQLDTPESWELLKKLATDDPRESVRKLAEQFRKRPFVSLILEAHGTTEK